MTTTSLAFLHAALDAAQAGAEAAADRAWSPHWEYDHFVHEIRDLNNGGELAVIYHPEIAAHVEANDPAAVLRRIAADRKQLEVHTAIECKQFTCDCHSCCATCLWTESDENGTELVWGEPTRHVYPCPTIRLIAEGWGWTEGA